MIINISEEFGYRLWEWDYPGTPEELVADWKAGKAPLNFFNPSKANPDKPYKGTMRQVEEFKGETGYYAHVHMPDDTYLKFNGVNYEVEDYTKHIQEMERETREILGKPAKH